MRTRFPFVLALLWIGLASGALSATDFPAFKHVTLDPNIGQVCYAVTVADVNNDGKPDPVALSENRLIWYENPTWAPHVILEDQLDRDHVCIAPYDIDADGLIDFAIGAGWTRKGTIQWISRDPENPDGPWKAYPIGIERWTHRMRWARMFGTGQAQLTVSPLNKTEGEGVRLLSFEIPEDPRTQRWPMTVLDNSLNRMHNHWAAPRIQPDGLDKLLTASQEGIHAVLLDGDDPVGTEFVTKKLSSGTEGDQPQSSGAGEIKIGMYNTPRMGTSFVATIEPMHGHQVVVYAFSDNEPTPRRFVLDDTLGRGHALWVANIDEEMKRDPSMNPSGDELIVGHSNPATGATKGPGIYIYRWSSEGNDLGDWEKHIIDDGGIATEDLIAHDFNDDGWIDILAGGRDTHNVKLYLNQGLAE